jgi:hypothetical protein
MEETEGKSGKPSRNVVSFQSLRERNIGLVTIAGRPTNYKALLTTDILLT